MNSLIALINALTAPVSLSALKSVLLAMVGQQQEFTFEVTIPSADVLTLNTTPIELVPAQGANKIIVPTTILAEMYYNTTPYATEGEVDVFCGGTRHPFTLPPDDGFLFGTVSRIVQAIPVITTGATSTVYVANQPMTLSMQGGNPTAGDSDIRIFGTYKVIDIS
jgi:hypothetical protein